MLEMPMSSTDQFDRNLKDAESLLERFRQSAVPNIIGGEVVADENLLDVLDPSTNEVLCKLSRGGASVVDRAAKAAMEAFPVWRDLPTARREKVLVAIAEAIEGRAREIALLESKDTGQPIRYMEKAAERGAANFRYYAKMASKAADGVSSPTATHVNYTTRVPIGPVGIITPWNTPFMLSTWKMAPALAAGCTVVHKPAEWSPLSGFLLAEIVQDVLRKEGLPAGIANLVQGLGEETGKALTEHPDIKAIAFVGESATGSAIMAQGAPTLKRVHFELGGKNPVIVFDDADMDRALDAVLFMIYSLNGQRCTSSSRALIQASIYDEFTARLVERIERIKVGDPLDPATEIGPLIHAEHLRKVVSYVGCAEEANATVAAGGRCEPDNGGNYFRPTLFTKASNDAAIAQEEIFGPVLTAISFADEAEAVRLANGVAYGLAGYIWTENTGRAHRVAHALDAGMIWVNSENVRHLPMPFGGMKASGIGRDGGEYAFKTYMEQKNIAISFGKAGVPKIGV